MHRIKPTPLPESDRFAVAVSNGDPHVPDGWPSELIHLIDRDAVLARKNEDGEEQPEVPRVREEMRAKLSDIFVTEDGKPNEQQLSKFREMTGAEVNRLRESLMDKWSECLDRKDAHDLAIAKRDAAEDLAHPDRFHVADQTRDRFAKAIKDAKTAVEVEYLRGKIARL